MLYVEIYTIQNEGSQKTLSVCRLLHDKVRCEGDVNFIQHLEKEGIWDYSKSPKKKVFPAAGRLFLEQLKNNFSSGYINASEVKEDRI